MENTQTYLKDEPEYSNKKRKLAVFLSIFFANLGIPYYYVGRPLLGFIASIPFLVLVIISFTIEYFSAQAFVLSVEIIYLLFLIINIGSAVLFAKRIIRDKNGKILK